MKNPELWPANYRANFREGEEQTVYPIKKEEQMLAMAQWLLNNANAGYLTAFILGLNMGLRVNELMSLQWKDVLYENGEVRYEEDLDDTSDMVSVHQSKTNKRRHVYLNDAVRTTLTWYKTVSAYNINKYNFFIFSFKADTLRKKLKRAAEACGVKQNVGTHTMRKTFGWWHYLHDIDTTHGNIAVLQRLFGHSSAQTTIRYLGIMDEEDKRLYRRLNLCPIDAVIALNKNSQTPNFLDKLA